MLKPISNGPIPPASPAKQLILRLAGELARLHDSQPSTLDLIDEARAYLSQPEPEGLTVEDCSNMDKHRVNFLVEDCPGTIVLDGCFTREDLIEIANTVPPTEA